MGAGSSNSFFGYGTGQSNTAGNSNSFFGLEAGGANTTGSDNSFFGAYAGVANTTGSDNSFFGRSAGFSNTTENLNSFIGAHSDGAAGFTNATAIGHSAMVTQSNSLVLGSIAHVNGSDANTNVGIGTTSPGATLEIAQDGSPSMKITGANNDNSSNVPYMFFAASRGTLYDPARSSKDDRLGLVGMAGYTGNAFYAGARIAAVASEDWSLSNRGAYLTFETVKTGTSTITESMRIDGSGNVGIGTTNPTAKLDVAGDLKVSGQILYGVSEETVPDYVFEPGHKLMPVEELGRFVEKEKHLPNIPNAAEIKEKGLSLSEFQMKNLEKIEELTLYTVQQAKTIREQQQRLTALEQIIAQQVPQERK